VTLSCDTMGRLVVYRYRSSGVDTYTYQPIVFTHGRSLIVCIRWKDALVELIINGVPLQLASEGVLPVSLYSLLSPLNIPVLPQLSGVAATLQNPDDQFFINTLHDMCMKLASESVYDKVRAAGLLRQLLLD